MIERDITIRGTVTILLLIIAVSVSGQRAIIKVLDNETGDPCPYANVVANTLDGRYMDAGVTDERGEISLSLDGIANVTVSFVGYQSQTEALRPGDSRTVRLEPDFFNLEQVVVTGQYEAKPVDKSIYKVDVIDSRTLQERGVNNLAEALSNETGIRLSVDPTTGTSLEIQGMGGENVKYLIDGVPIIGRVDGNIDLSQINMENVDHIELIQGPMSVQYGTSAIAGVINIITRENTYFKNVTSANSYVDNKGNYNFGLYGSIIKKHHTLSLSGNRNLFQGIDLDDSNRYMDFKPKRVYNADADYAYNKNNFRLRVKSQYMNSLLKFYSNYIDKVVIAYDADYNTTRSTNSIILSDKLSDRLSYNIIGSYTYFGRSTDYITSDLYLLTKELTGTSSTVFNNVMSRGSFSYTLPDVDLSFMAGWELTYENGAGDKIEDEAKIGDYAVFLSSQYTPFKLLSLQPGLRVIYNTIYGAPVIPSMNVKVILTEDFSGRISYARGFRAPSLKELYLDFKDSNHDLSGNKDLKAETTNSFNGSLDYNIQTALSRIEIEPGFFYNNGKDAITLIVTNAESNSATNVNIGGRRTLGGEVNTTWRHKSGMMIGAGMSRIGETYDSEGSGDYLPVVYYNNYSVNTKYKFRKLNAVLLANIKYYGRTPALTSIPEDNGGGYYRIYTDPYGDLEFTFTKIMWKNRINLVLGGKNLLNNYWRRTSGYRDFGQTGFQAEYLGPMNYGRTFFVKLNVKFNN